MLNPIEMFKMVGNANQAVALYQDLVKLDSDHDGIPEVIEMLDKAKEIVADLNELNKDALELLAMYSQLMPLVNEKVQRK